MEYFLDEKLLSGDICQVLRAQENGERSVTFANGKLVDSICREQRGVSALCLAGGKRGFASTTEFSRCGAADVVSQAVENLRTLGKPERFVPDKICSEISSLPAVRDISQREMTEIAAQIDLFVAAACPKAKGRILRIITLYTEKQILTSEGLHVKLCMPRTNIYLTLTAEDKNGIPVTLRDSTGGKGFLVDVYQDVRDISAFVEELYEDLMQKCNCVGGGSGERLCIFSDCSGLLIHEAFGHLSEADAVLNKCVLAGQLGKRIVSPLISVTDFAAEAFGEAVPQTIPVDDEGTVCVDAPIINEGVLRGYMHSRKTAERLEFQNTGNARASLFSDIPVVRMRNTAIHPGTSTKEDMIAAVDDGILIKRTGGGSADMTGKYMFSVQMAYRIRNGHIAEPLGDVVCTGNSFGTLGNVKMVGNDFKWRHSSLCGKSGQEIPVGMGGPSILSTAFINGR